MTPPPYAGPDLATLAAARCKDGAPKLTPAELSTHLYTLPAGPERAATSGRVAWTAHDADGVTRNNVVRAAKTDRLYAG